VQVLQLIGGIYLIYLAIDAFRTFRKFNKENGPEIQPAHKTLLKAAFVNLLNPNPYLGWSLVMDHSC